VLIENIWVKTDNVKKRLMRGEYLAIGYWPLAKFSAVKENYYFLKALSNSQQPTANG
jgi:hypothetical protein